MYWKYVFRDTEKMLLDYPGIWFSGGNKISHLLWDGEKAIERVMERAGGKKLFGISEIVHWFSRRGRFVLNIRKGFAHISWSRHLVFLIYQICFTVIAYSIHELVLGSMLCIQLSYRALGALIVLFKKKCFCWKPTKVQPVGRSKLYLGMSFAS